MRRQHLVYGFSWQTNSDKIDGIAPRCKNCGWIPKHQPDLREMKGYIKTRRKNDVG
jgi:hypothetical protein